MIKKSINSSGASLSTTTICAGFSLPDKMSVNFSFIKIVFIVLSALSLIEKFALFIFQSIDLICTIRFFALFSLSVKAYCFVLS